MTDGRTRGGVVADTLAFGAMQGGIEQMPVPWRIKSTRRIELRAMMPASAMKLIIEVAVIGAPNVRCDANVILYRASGSPFMCYGFVPANWAN